MPDRLRARAALAAVLILLTAAGTRAVQQLKQVITALKMVPVLESVNIPFHAQFIRDGRFYANDVLEQAATAMLDELLRIDGALRPLRAAAAA